MTVKHIPDQTTGQVLNSLSVGGRNEAHHSGLTDDRRYLWAGGLDTSKIFVFDLHTDAAKPRVHKVIDPRFLLAVEDCETNQESA